MRGLFCALAGRVPGDRPEALAAHRRSCLRCQAATARDHAVRRGLEALVDELTPAPFGLKAQVLARLGRQDASDPRRDLVARAAARYAAAAGLAVASLVALAAGAARRHSRALG